MTINLSPSRDRLYTKVLVRPFVYSKPSVRVSYITMLVFLSIQIFMLALAQNWDSLWILFASCTASVAAGYMDKLYHTTDRFTVLPGIVQGIIVGLLLPSSYPPVTVFFITFCATVLTKLLAGGFACSWCNAAALTVVVAWLIGFKSFPPYAVSADIITMQNPSLTLIQNGTIPLLKHDAEITDFLNNTVFKLFRVSIPDGYISLLWDNQSVIPAFRFNLITLISSAVLFAADIISFIIPLVFLATYGLLVRFLLPVICGGIAGQGDVLLAFMTSGTLFCSLYLLQWFGTIPRTVQGKIIYAVLAGICAFIIAGCGTSSVGMAFTVLAVNVISSIIQVIEDNKDRKAVHQLVEKKLPAKKDDEHA